MLVYLALPNAKICVTPDANPRCQSVEYRWRWVFWHWPCIFHVYFMYISCIFHLVCASFFALAMRKLVDAKADSSGIWALRPYYTMRCLTGVFFSPRVFHFTSRFPSRFSSRFRYQHVGIQNARENTRKTREKSKTRAQRETMFLYYTVRWVKTRVSCVLVAFWSRFGRVLVAIWSRFGPLWSQTLPKRKPNA